MSFNIAHISQIQEDRAMIFIGCYYPNSLKNIFYRPKRRKIIETDFKHTGNFILKKSLCKELKKK